MVYHGTYNKETIAVHPMNSLGETHFIEMVKSAEEPIFWVTCCCDDDWYYEFYLECNSDYEAVKFAIMEMICDCETMDELLDTLSDMFECDFADMMVDRECDCETGCNHCGCM